MRFRVCTVSHPDRGGYLHACGYMISMVLNRAGPWAILWRRQSGVLERRKVGAKQLEDLPIPLSTVSPMRQRYCPVQSDPFASLSA